MGRYARAGLRTRGSWPWITTSHLAAVSGDGLAITCHPRLPIPLRVSSGFAPDSLLSGEHLSGGDYRELPSGCIESGECEITHAFWDS